jgi:hypothetical protein
MGLYLTKHAASDSRGYIGFPNKMNVMKVQLQPIDVGWSWQLDPLLLLLLGQGRRIRSDGADGPVSDSEAVR